MSTTYLPTYSEIAKDLGISWCRGIRPNGQRCFAGHRAGFVSEGQIHFEDRRVSRSGIRRFLFLGAMVKTEGNDWRRYYRANRLVTEWIRQIHIEIPRSVTAPYKAAVKAMLAAVPPGDEEREEAWLWANR